MELKKSTNQTNNKNQTISYHTLMITFYYLVHPRIHYNPTKTSSSSLPLDWCIAGVNQLPYWSANITNSQILLLLS